MSLREEEEKKEDIYSSLDTQSKDEVALPAQPARCAYYDQMQACPHELEALGQLAELYRTRHGLRSPLRHPNLHWFVHEYGIENVMILARDRIERDKNTDFLKTSTLFTRTNSRAQEHLAEAKERLAAETEEQDRKICRHLKGQFKYISPADGFECYECKKPVADEIAATYGFTRDKYVDREEGKAFIAAIFKKIAGASSFSAAGD